MTNKLKIMIKAVVIVTVFSIITRALGFLFRIYLSWELGAEMLGLYQVAFSVLGVLVMLVSSGLPLALSKQTAILKSSENKNGMWSATSATLIISVALSIILCALIFLFQSPMSNIFADARVMPILLTLLPAVIFSAIYSSFRGSLWGVKDFFGVSATEFIEQVVRILLFFLMANVLTTHLSGAINASVSFSMACFVSAVVAIVWYYLKGGRLKNPASQYRNILKSATPVTGVRVATSIIQPLIAIIIPFELIAIGFTKELAIAEFGIAVGMTLPLLFLPSTLVGSLAMVLLPELSSDMHAKNHEKANTQIQAAFTFSIFISMLIVPLYMGMSEDIGLFVYNNAKAGYYLLLSAWLMIPIALSNISSTILNAMGLEGKSFKNYLFGAIFLIVCMFTLTRFIGILSLIVGMGGCMLISCMLNNRMIKKRLNIETNILKKTAQMALLAIPCLFLASNTLRVVGFFAPKFFALAFGSIVGAVAFIALCVIFRVLDLSMIILEIKNKKFSRRAPTKTPNDLKAVVDNMKNK